MTKNNKMGRLFTLFIVSFPLLYLYNTGLSTLSIADIILLIFLISFFAIAIKSGRRITVNNTILAGIALVLLQSVVYLLLGFNDKAALLSSFRIIFYYFSCSVLVRELFNIEKGKEYFKKIAFLAACFWLLQFFALNIFNVFIQGTIPGLSTQVDSYNAIMNSHSWTSFAFARPRAFFAEPSHFAVYVSLGLLIYLYDYRKKETPQIIVLILSILLSGSGMAIVLLTVVSVMIIAKNRKKISKNQIIAAIAATIIATIAIPFYTQTKSFQTFYERTFVVKDSTEGRFGNFADAFNFNKSAREVIIGEGIYKIEDIEGQKYITSIPRIYVYFGIVGLLLFFTIAAICMFSLKGLNLYVLILLISICFGSEILFHGLVVPFLPFIITKEKYEQ